MKIDIGDKLLVTTKENVIVCGDPHEGNHILSVITNRGDVPTFLLYYPKSAKELRPEEEVHMYNVCLRRSLIFRTAFGHQEWRPLFNDNGELLVVKAPNIKKPQVLIADVPEYSGPTGIYPDAYYIKKSCSNNTI